MYLNINISQKVCLTPEIQHAIKVLSMSTNELNEEIINEINDNILIESSDTNTMSGVGKNNIEVDSNSSILDTIEHKIDLREHLRRQVELLPINNNIKVLINELIEYIDEDGWLDDDVVEIEQRLYPEVLSALQSLDPSGIGGRGLEEVLLIQAKETGSKLMELLITTELESVAIMDYAGIAKRLKKDISEIKLCVNEIKKLNPKPGSSFIVAETPEVPDARIYTDGDEIYIELINNIFDIKIIDNSKAIVKQNKDLKDSLIKAKSLINSIRHRNQTLELVLGSIVKKQRQYFLHGDISMAPLTMNEVAEDCGVHESTVSRISSSKVVQTPYGMLSIKEFFCSSINTDDGSISSRGVKKIIKSMISEEIITKPISDMYITNELNQHGINISRRTVAKYRSAMNIPSSSSRIIKLKKQ
jgi:RNA polymerase sigma-54 factor